MGRLCILVDVRADCRYMREELFLGFGQFVFDARHVSLKIMQAVASLGDGGAWILNMEPHVI